MLSFRLIRALSDPAAAISPAAVIHVSVSIWLSGASASRVDDFQWLVDVCESWLSMNHQTVAVDK